MAKVINQSLPAKWEIVHVATRLHVNSHVDGHHNSKNGPLLLRIQRCHYLVEEHESKKEHAVSN